MNETRSVDFEEQALPIEVVETTEETGSKPMIVSFSKLMESGAHYGHQTSK